MKSGNGKVAVIGAGYVGAQVTYAIAMRKVAKELVLIDVNKKKAEGEAKDIRHGLPFMDTTKICVGDYSDCADCDLIIITAGRGRKPGETRLDLTNENIAIMRSVTDAIKKYYTRGVVMIITNPVDILTMKATEWMDLAPGMVFGTGCILDTSRFLRTVADKIDIDITELDGYMVGAHGEYPVPVWTALSVGGEQIDSFCEKHGLSWDAKLKVQITEHTKNLGAEIIAAKGRTDFGISICACRLADAILNDRPIETPVSSVLSGQYGIDGLALSVPSVIDASGVRILECSPWSSEEQAEFAKAACMIQKTIDQLALI